MVYKLPIVLHSALVGLNFGALGSMVG